MSDILTESDLAGFTGSEHVFKHRMTQVLYTKGVQYVAEKGGAYWLLDKIVILSKWEKAIRRESFQVWTLKVGDKSKATLICDDGNGNEVYREVIEWTDFPLKEIKFYLTSNVLMLPREF